MNEITTREIPISPEYVQHWNIAEAGRELIANYLDSGRAISDLNWDNDWVLTNAIDERLPSSILVLGNSTKSVDDDSVGQFGEGLKLAIVVLLRAGYGVKIYNHDVLWDFCFEESENWDNCRILKITESPLGEETNLFRVVVEKGAELWDELHSYCLDAQLSQEAGDVATFATENAQIYFTQMCDGHVFVGGIYIENESRTRYLIDLRPDGVSLNRERSTINNDTLYNAYKELFERMATAYIENDEFAWLGGYLTEMLRTGSYSAGIIKDCFEHPYIQERAEALKNRIKDKEVVYSDNEEAVAHKMGVTYVRLNECEKKILEETGQEIVRYSRKEGMGTASMEVDNLFKFLASWLDEKGLSELKEDEQLLERAKRMRALAPHWISTINW